MASGRRLVAGAYLPLRVLARPLATVLATRA